MTTTTTTTPATTTARARSRRLTSTLCLALLLAGATTPRAAHAGDGQNRSIGPISADLTLFRDDLACDCDLVIYVTGGAHVTITLPTALVTFTPSVTVVGDQAGGTSFTIVAGDQGVVAAGFTTRGQWTSHQAARKWLRTG